tara:strand:- start:263 stop:457 length:195 start_codon:yes stop_codon:yes gene_type:complete
MIDLIKLSKEKIKKFLSEEELRVFTTRLTYKANKRGFAVSYKISPDTKNLTYCLIEKTTYPLKS